MNTKGFTIIELLVVIAIIGILASIVQSKISHARERAQYNRALLEMRHMETALFLYREDHAQVFPADVDRSLPPGLETYLHNPSNVGAWPDAPLPGSVYDWDNWSPTDLTYGPFEQVYQISIRFCKIDGTDCHFPNQPWATGFDAQSAMYYCIQGPCRSHPSKPVSHKGYCVNC